MLVVCLTAQCIQDRQHCYADRVMFQYHVADKHVLNQVASVLFCKFTRVKVQRTQMCESALLMMGTGEARQSQTIITRTETSSQVSMTVS